MNGEQTLDRDVRMTPEQIHYAAAIVRKRISELGRSIAAAEANRAAGGRIQHGVYERHLVELNTLSQLRDSLEAARKQVQRRLSEALGLA